MRFSEPKINNNNNESRLNSTLFHVPWAHRLHLKMFIKWAWYWFAAVAYCMLLNISISGLIINVDAATHTHMTYWSTLLSVDSYRPLWLLNSFGFYLTFSVYRIAITQVHLWTYRTILYMVLSRNEREKNSSGNDNLPTIWLKLFFFHFISSRSVVAIDKIEL